MGNYKVKVGSEAESKEAQELFVALGGEVRLDDRVGIVCLTEGKIYTDDIKFYDAYGDCKELTIPQLRDMVVLKRNDPKDATHIDQYGDKWIHASGVWYFYTGKKKWDESLSRSMSRYELKPITKEPVMKEFLVKTKNDEYILLNDVSCIPSEFVIKVPEGADTAACTQLSKKITFFKDSGYSQLDEGKWHKCGIEVDGVRYHDVGEFLSFGSGAQILWQRETQPEALPFIGNEVHEAEISNFKIGSSHAKETMSDKVASAEVARQSGVFVGSPFSDLPEVNFEAADVVDAEFFPDEKHSHYKKDVSHLGTLDIYRVTELFNPHSCGAHIAKKALCSGQRGHKDLLTDIQDIIDTAERWKEMLIEDENSGED